MIPSVDSRDRSASPSPVVKVANKIIDGSLSDGRFRRWGSKLSESENIPHANNRCEYVESGELVPANGSGSNNSINITPNQTTNITTSDIVDDEEVTLSTYNTDNLFGSVVGDDAMSFKKPHDDAIEDDDDDNDNDDDSQLVQTAGPMHRLNDVESVFSSSWRSFSSPTVSILKLSSMPLAVNERGPWKRLPKPNMQLIESEQIKKYTQAAIHYKSGNITVNKRQSVHFGYVEVRHYKQTIGDNPAVSCGVPIQLDWEYEESENDAGERVGISIDTYETLRMPRRRNNPKKFCMNYFQRMNQLSYYYGFPEEELKRAERSINRIRNQREFTVALVPFCYVEDFVRSAVRKTRRLIKHGNCRSGATFAVDISTESTS